MKPPTNPMKAHTKDVEPIGNQGNAQDTTIVPIKPVTSAHTKPINIEPKNLPNISAS